MTTKRKNNLSAKARAAGLPEAVVLQRVNKLGWDEERALTTPVRKNKKRKTVVTGSVPALAPTSKPSSSIFDVRTLTKPPQLIALVVIVTAILIAVNA